MNPLAKPWRRLVYWLTLPLFYVFFLPTWGLFKVLGFFKLLEDWSMR